MAFSFVNNAQNSNDSSGNSLATAAANHTTGDLIVVMFRWEGGGVSDTATVSFSDTAGNTYTILGHKSTGAGSEDARIGVAYCIDCTGNASNVVTGTITASRSFRRIIACSYSYTGTVVLGEDEGEGSSSTNTTTITTDTALDAGADDITFLFVGNYNGSVGFAPDAGFTERGFGSGALAHTCDDIGTYSATPGGTFSTGDTYVALTCTFEQSGSSLPLLGGSSSSGGF